AVPRLMVSVVSWMSDSVRVRKESVAGLKPGSGAEMLTLEGASGEVGMVWLSIRSRSWKVIVPVAVVGSVSSVTAPVAVAATMVGASLVPVMVTGSGERRVGKEGRVRGTP